jgi:hypothetical protein
VPLIPFLLVCFAAERQESACFGSEVKRTPMVSPSRSLARNRLQRIFRVRRTR